jgi:aspartate carbamoyltransferase catalytic subunit
MVAELAAEAGPSIHLINAGNGCIEHPTQALLDAVTLLHHHDDLDHLIITIAGDICHSRVARSAVEIFTKMGVSQIRLAGPEELLPAQSIRDAKIFSCLDEAVDGANVIMMLRIQHERFGQVSLPDNDAFYRQWGLDAERLSKAAADCLVLHPGPVNRGVEIASEVADGTQSLIREQVNNGVFVRMAVLLTLLEV